MAACFRLVSPLEIHQHQHQEKGCLMVMADPSDLGHGKKGFRRYAPQNCVFKVYLIFIYHNRYYITWEIKLVDNTYINLK